MRSGTIAILLGVVLLQQFSELPALEWGGLVLVAALAMYACPRMRLPFFLVLGFCWALMHGHGIQSRTLPVALEGEELVIEGEVVSIPSTQVVSSDHPLTDIASLGFQFRIDRVVSGAPLDSVVDQVLVPLLVKLSWYRTAVRPGAGEYWRLRVRLKRVNGFMNPGGFDYEGLLFQQGITATGYVREGEINTRILPAACIFCVNRWRQRMADHLDQMLTGSDNAGLVKALMIGERSDITTAQWDLLARSGTNHLLAISGLHIGLISGLAYWIMLRCWGFGYGLSLRLPAQKAAAVAAIVAAFGYAAMAGFSIPTRRALVMVCVAMFALLRGRNVASSQILAMALLLVLLLDPASVLSPGFWLSFGAVAVILYGMSCRVRGEGVWWRWGRVQWLVAVGLLPLTLMWFQQASVISPIANLMAVPFVGLLVVPMLFLATIVSLLSSLLSDFTGAALFTWVDQLIKLLWWWLQWLSTLPFSLWVRAIPSLWVLGSMLVGVVVFLAPHGLPRKLGIIFFIPLLLHRVETPVAGEIWVTVLDVGQGLSVVVQTSRHTLLFDTGPGFNDKFDTGRAVVVPFLRQRGIDHIDTVIISHANQDHSGGLNSILKALPVERLLYGEKLTGRAALLHPFKSQPCQDGQSWSWDDVEFGILHPSSGFVASNTNDQSCVLQIQSAGNSILLTGDIQRRGEARLVAQYGEALASDILVVPHHGSKTSSSGTFVAQVNPRYTIFSSGYRNRFGHPHPLVVDRYGQNGSVMADTSQAGAISFSLHPQEGIRGPRLYRHEAHHYWNR